jgi:uncharacterized protein
MGYAVKLIDRLLSKTKDGFIKENVTIARVGAMDYLGSELGMGLKPNEVYQVYVDADELFKPETIESADGIDITFQHPDSLEITLDDWSELSVGHVQNIHQDGDYLKGTIFVKDKSVIDIIEKQGIKEVSLGYDSDIIEKNGKLVKTNIRANHLAIVPEGRCGSACKIGDSKKVKTTMAKKPVALKVGDSIAKMFGLKTSAHKAVSRKFGDTKKSIHSTKAKLGDAAKKTLKDVELGLAAEATEEEKQVALEAVATLSTEIEQAIEILNGADESVAEAEEAVEEITVNDATLPEGVSIPEELTGYVNELEQERAAAEEKLADAEIRIKELEDELAALKAEGETSTAVADAKARFPKIKLGDAKSARDVQAQVLVAKGIYTDAQAKTLTDCAIGSAYQALAVTEAKPASNFGKKLIGDSKPKSKLSANQRLGG